MAPVKKAASARGAKHASNAPPTWLLLLVLLQP
jgi:hypothetical protein